MLRQADRWGIPARTSAVGVLVTLLYGLALVWPTVSAHLWATALLGDVVLRLPVRPLTWVTADPVTEELRWRDGGYGVLTRPGGSHEPAPALVMTLGAEPAEPDDPRVQRLTEGLARVGMANLLVRAEPLIDGQVTPDEVSLLVGAFEALRSRPDIDPERIALFGLSVGGSLQLVAAADQAIADDVWFVLALGPHFDAGTLAAEVMSGTFRTPDGIETWEPDETSLRVVEKTLLAALPPEERDRITSGGEAATADGRVAQALLARPPLDEAEALIPELSAEARKALEAISPRYHLDRLRAPVYLLHDRNDPFIPWTHSDAIAAAYETDVYYKLDIFEHVEPQVDNLGVLIRDGYRLWRLFADIIKDMR